MPSPYRKRVAWIEVTPEITKKYLAPLRYPDYEKIGESIGYSAEYIRQIFVDGRPRLNPVVFEGIVKWLENNDKAKSSPAKKTTTPLLTFQKTTTKNVKPATTTGSKYLEQRRQLKSSKK